ncbi:IS30 family transposase [Legionella geestiana]|uniref:IS30 family transposase n=1 Tax=Legionella geestiana TaxID=45065 RepID=UPI00048F9BED|nr:IS30 family transposase [Legionella geestiana]QBS11854.1 IS30 family transposase [Legionella geestiana]STX53450.1 IS30B/C/D transposase [Legionella geestiana]
MGKKYNHLSTEERCRISILQREGYSLRKIASVMGRSTSTLSREIRRNTTKSKGYDVSYADVQARARRWRGSRLERQPALCQSVLDLLAMGWSPQAVAKRLAQERGCPIISYESIYRFIYGQIKRTKEYGWRHFLPTKRYTRRHKAKRKHSSTSFIKDRVSIHKRPKRVLKRNQIGHWEVDLMQFSKQGGAILVAHERYSRALLLSKIQTKEALPIAKQLGRLFSSLPEGAVKTVTFDNGTEFAEHHQLAAYGIQTYFCDAYSPWQKGGVENAIGRLRRFLPRKTDFQSLSEEELMQHEARFNLTPRKCLGYKTPAEVFSNKVLHFKCERSSPPARE